MMSTRFYKSTGIFTHWMDEVISFSHPAPVAHHNRYGGWQAGGYGVCLCHRRCPERL